MASPPSTPSPSPAGPEDPVEEEPHDVPLTMSASVVLESLPRDAQTALELAARSWDHPSQGRKVTVRFKAVGSAPILRTQVYKISASQRFETVVNFLRKNLKCGPTQSVFCYVNSVFAPALDEGVGALWRVSAPGSDRRSSF
ncbi:MAG: Ubiquitin-like protein [Chaenotheca gracillima]|nr:MAG: Ubiquitin-like protein [Chaenotheca gracillima]